MKRKGQVVHRKRSKRCVCHSVMKRKESWVRDSSGKRRKRGLRKEKLRQWGEWTGITSVNSMCVFPSFFGKPCHSVPWLISRFPSPCRMLRCQETRMTADSFTWWCTSLPTLSTPDPCPSCPLTLCSTTTSAAWLPSSAWSRGGTGRASRRCRPSRGCWTLRRWTAITHAEPFPVRLVGLSSSQIRLLGLVVVSAGVVFLEEVGGGWGGGWLRWKEGPRLDGGSFVL